MYSKPAQFVVAVLAAGIFAEGAGAQAPAAPSAAAADPLQTVKWMAGCWEQRAGERVATEMWMPPAGGMMVGGSRTVARGAARAYEHLRITAVEGKLVYTAVPSGQKETAFTSAVVGAAADSIVFENPAHDFPTRITYRRMGADSLVARVEGPGQGGAMRGFVVAMRRVSCQD